MPQQTTYSDQMGNWRVEYLMTDIPKIDRVMDCRMFLTEVAGVGERLDFYNQNAELVARYPAGGWIRSIRLDEVGIGKGG